jgi:hypothetical protein
MCTQFRFSTLKACVYIYIYIYCGLKHYNWYFICSFLIWHYYFVQLYVQFTGMLITCISIHCLLGHLWCRYINVVARWHGSVHDTRVLRNSPLFTAFEGNQPPLDGILLGDSGYMIRTWLMTPIMNPANLPEVNLRRLRKSVLLGVLIPRFVQNLCTVHMCMLIVQCMHVAFFFHYDI